MKELPVFRYAGVFYLVALGTTVLAFGGVAPQFAIFAQVAFGLFLTLAFLSIMLGLIRKGF
jgi:uncharacterized membrane protein YtjA (UPF0391 family)